jgi:hypothetical protein
MSRKGKFFIVILKEAHLNWGTEGNSRSTRMRNKYESYIPISAENARVFNITRGEVFSSISDDSLFEGDLKATGSQGTSKEYGKNFVKSGDMRALGYWLKDRKQAVPGDKVKVFFKDEQVIELSFIKS